MYQMRLTNSCLGRIFFAAFWQGDRAPGVEVATRWGVDGRGDIALEDHPVAWTVRVRDRDRRQQCLGVGVNGVGVETIAGCELDDAPKVHHGNTI